MLAIVEHEIETGRTSITAYQRKALSEIEAAGGSVNRWQVDHLGRVGEVGYVSTDVLEALGLVTQKRLNDTTIVQITESGRAAAHTA